MTPKQRRYSTNDVDTTFICNVLLTLFRRRYMKQRRYTTSAKRRQMTSIQLSYATSLRRRYMTPKQLVTRRWQNVDKWRWYNFQNHHVFDVVSTLIYDVETTSLLDVGKTLTKDVDTIFIVTMFSTLFRRRYRRRNNIATTFLCNCNTTSSNTIYDS